jgi:class 3 adenylate cyclase
MRTLTLTILISDLQGYTERQARSSRAAIAEDLERYGALLRPIFAAFGGEVVKSMGDAFLVCFDSPTNAVLAAVQVQKQLEVHNQALPEGVTPLLVRIGIATGEVSRDDGGDVFGDPVNLASRLQSSADSSAIWLAETTFLSMNKNEVQALEVGARVFKGVPGEVKVYRVLDAYIASARALTEAELERRFTPLKHDATRTRRVAVIALVVALAVAAALYFFLRREGDARHGDTRSAEARFTADVHDVASGDVWMDELAARLYAADEGEVQRLYREGTMEAHLERARPTLGERPSFVRTQLVWGMSSAPLQRDLAQAVEAGVTQHALLRDDPRFVELLRETVEYALRDEECHALYTRALSAAEAP